MRATSSQGVKKAKKGKCFNCGEKFDHYAHDDDFCPACAAKLSAIMDSDHPGTTVKFMKEAVAIEFGGH